MGRNEERIAIYSRKSRFTGKGESIGNQIELCKDYIRNLYGKDSAERCVVFEDEGFSGGNLKRPGFRKMMSDVRKHKFRAIVVYRLDRISRNISDFTGLIDELTKLEVAFISIREQFDTSTPMGRAMMFIISVFSQLERETIAERIRDNMQELAKTGRWLGGNTPTGYASEGVSKETIDGKVCKSFHLKILPDQAQTVKTIFELYAQTDSLTATETQLLCRRIKTKTGKDFTRFAIKTILQNPVYMAADAGAYDYFAARGADICSPRDAFDGTCGVMCYNRTDQEKGRATVLLPVSQWIVAVGKHPALIPSSQWIRVQFSLERNKNKAYRKPRSNEALLTGRIFCVCGERMYPKLTQRKNAAGELVYTYVCKGKERSKGELCRCRNVNGNELDAAVMEEVKKSKGDKKYFVAQLEKSRPFYCDVEEPYVLQMADLRAAYTENESNIDSLIDSLATAGESAAKQRIIQRIEKLSESNEEMERRIQELERLTAPKVLTGMDWDRFRQKAVIFREVISEMSIQEKREMVCGVVSRVIWNGENAQVVLLGGENCNGEKIPLCEDSK